MTNFNGSNGSQPQTPSSAAARLRELLRGPEPVQAPGAYDALSARIVADAGFPVVYMTGYRHIGWPPRPARCGLLSAAEMVDNARRIVIAVECPSSPTPIPAMATRSTFAAPFSAMKTAGRGRHPHRGPGGAQEVRPHGRASRSSPPRRWCRSCAPPSTARRDPDFVIIARTDARAVVGLDEAIERGRRYRMRAPT